MQHLLGETSSVVEHEEEIFQQAGGEVSEGSWVAQIVSLLILQVQQTIHLRPVMAAVTDPLVVSGDCDQTGFSQTANCQTFLLKHLSLPLSLPLSLIIKHLAVSYLELALASLLF